MAEIDYLNQRTTNINIRISPMLKTQLIDSGASQGLNLSDYIMHLLLTEMSGGNQSEYSSEEYESLSELSSDLFDEREALQKELNQYQKLTAQFEDYVGQTVVIEGEKIELKTQFDVLTSFLKCIKYQTI